MEFTKRNFNGGELSPAILARPDLEKYATGLEVCENFFVLKEGGAYNRAGFKFLNHAISSEQTSRLIPFEFSTVQNYIVEFGEGKLRVIKDGGFVLESNFTIDAVSGDTVTASGHDFANGDTVFIQNVDGVDGINNRYLAITNVSGDDFDLVGLGNTQTPGGLTGAVVARLFEVEHPYSSGDLKTMQHTQSADVMTLVHRDHPIRELSRFGHDDWRLDEVSYTESIPRPTSVQAQTIGTDSTSDNKDYQYVVTAVRNGVESEASANTVINMSAQSITYGAELFWAEPEGGADFYNIYKAQSVGSGIYGWIGESKSPKFEDFNLGPVMTQGVPEYRNPIDTRFLIVTNPDVLTPGQIVVGSSSGAKGTVESIDDDTVTLKDVTGAFEAGDFIASNDGSIEFTNVSGTFVLNEEVTGATSGATARVKRFYQDSSGKKHLEVYALSGTFQVAEIVTGGTYIASAEIVSVDNSKIVEVTGLAGGGYPSTVAYYQQRFITANSIAEPQTVWTSRSGDYKDFRVSLPAVDSDAVTFTIATEKVNEIRHILPLKALILLTSGGIWKVTEGQNDVLTPASVGVKFQSAEGASWLRPIRRRDSAIYVQDRGSRMRDLNYSFENDAFSGRDITVFARHLFEGHEIVSWCYATEPFEIIWAVRDDGVLLGVTYDPQEQVLGWHRHTTNGLFEEVNCTREGREDALYAVIKRTISGQEQRFIERMDSRLVDTCESSYFVDAGLSYSGDPTQEVVNLHHLEGEVVTVLADGNYLGDDFIVQDGKITLDKDASFSTIHVGLPYSSTLTMPPIRFPDGVYEGKRKSVSEVVINYYKTRGATISTQGNEEDVVKWRTNDDNYDTPDLFTGMREAKTSMGWRENTSITIRQRKPLPCAILSLTPAFAKGG